MNHEPVSYERVAIEPLACLTEAKDLVGEQYWLFVGICAVGSLLGGVAPFGILLGPMLCGMYLCYFCRMRGEVIRFDVLFQGFEHFVQSLIATLIMVGVSLVFIGGITVMIVVVIIGAEAASHEAESYQALLVLLVPLYLLLFVVSLLIGTCFIFAYPLIADRGLDGVTAVKLSLQAVFANFWGVMGLMLLNAVIGIVASLCCYLPVFFFLPISFGAMAIAYRKVFPRRPPVIHGG